MAHRVPMLEEHRVNHLDAKKTSSKLEHVQQPPVTPSHPQHRSPPRVVVHDRRRHPRRSKHYHGTGGGATPTSPPIEVI